jgi:hypothetical protein
MYCGLSGTPAEPKEYIVLAPLKIPRSNSNDEQ